jgi:ATP-dependent DNA helicase RecG
METKELVEIVRRGEDSTLQFKASFHSIDQLVAEMAAMSNYRGGQILVGVDDAGALTGITADQVRQLNGWISSGSQHNISPSILPRTTSVPIAEGLVVLVIEVPSSDSKPHFDKNGIIWIKAGADKRKVGSREEFRRLFQESELIHADAVAVSTANIEDLSQTRLRSILVAKFGDSQADKILGEAPFPLLLENLDMSHNGKPTIAGLLLIGDNPQRRIPAFAIKAIAWVGNDPTGMEYRDSENIEGTLGEMFKLAMAFVSRQLHKIQAGQGFNSVGQWEIPREALEELLVNALIHRDYFISDTIKLWVFEDRVEITSPGVLPNNLTVEKIRLGSSNMRNPILGSFGVYTLPYRGAGTGVRRALLACPGIQLLNDANLNVFKVTLPRPLQVKEPS